MTRPMRASKSHRVAPWGWTRMGPAGTTAWTRSMAGAEQETSECWLLDSLILCFIVWYWISRLIDWLGRLSLRELARIVYLMTLYCSAVWDFELGNFFWTFSTKTLSIRMLTEQFVWITENANCCWLNVRLIVWSIDRLIGWLSACLLSIASNFFAGFLRFFLRKVFWTRIFSQNFHVSHESLPTPPRWTGVNSLAPARGSSSRALPKRGESGLHQGSHGELLSRLTSMLFQWIKMSSVHRAMISHEKMG